MFIALSLSLSLYIYIYIYKRARDASKGGPTIVSTAYASAFSPAGLCATGALAVGGDTPMKHLSLSLSLSLSLYTYIHIYIYIYAYR